MSILATIKTFWVCHLLLFYIMLMSGLIVTFLMLLTYIFIWPFNKALYRKIVVHLGYAWWSQFTFLAQWWSGGECTVQVGNLEDLSLIGKEHVIATMNHKYDIDWLMAWIIAERLQMLGGTKIYGKKSLKMVPLVGWAWTFTESIFLKREWDKDRATLVKDLSYICDYPNNYWVTLLLFAEGTRFTEAKHKASMEVARQKGLPELKHHLLPRTKGFVLSMQGVKGKMHSILDLTIGFTNDGAAPHFWNVINGKPINAQIYVRRIPLEQVPTDTDEACAAWLHKLYREKDEIYDNFHKNGRYTIGTNHTIPRRYHDLIMWVFWAVLTCIPLFYYLMQIFVSGSLYLKLGVVIGCLLLYVVARKMMGITQIVKGSKYGKQKSVENDKKSD